MSDKKAEFIPFHAVNEFMRPDYRLAVVRTALTALSKLPNQFRTTIDKFTRQVVRVPGFRNSLQAPIPLRVGPTAEAFETSPKLVAAVLAAWAEAQADLRQKVFDLLQGRGWEILPAEADRTQLPGFLIHWPNREEDFEVLNQAYAEAYPGEEVSKDDVSLMIVWLSGRLPFKAEGEEGEAEPDGTSALPD